MASNASKTQVKKEATLEDLQTEIATLKADIGTLTTTLRDYGSSKGDQISAAARDKVHHLQKSASEGATEAARLAERAYAGTENKIRENPTAAVGIAAGLGFLVGLIASRRA